MMNRRSWLGTTALASSAIAGISKMATSQDPASAVDLTPRNFEPAKPAHFANAKELLREDPIAPTSKGAPPAHWDDETAPKCGCGPSGIAKEFGPSGPVVRPGSRFMEFLDDDDPIPVSNDWLTQLVEECGGEYRPNLEYYEIGVTSGELQLVPEDDADLPEDDPDPNKTKLVPNKTKFLGYGRRVNHKTQPQTPGPKFMARLHHPMVIRFVNELDDYLSVHLHGGHGPAHSDGHPTFVIPRPTSEDKKGKCGYVNNHRDYYYPHTIPAELPPGVPASDRLKYLDYGEAPSTLWYHDHSMDITGPHVYMGLAGFMPIFDDLELDLLGRGVLPMCGRFQPSVKYSADAESRDRLFEDCKTNPLDHTIVLQDRLLSTSNQLLYSVTGHNGMLGNMVLVNGQWRPKMTVAPRQYRFRFLNGSNARFYKLELYAHLEDPGNPTAKSELIKLRKKLPNGSAWHRIGRDSWLFPEAIRQDKVLLGMAARADMVIDFEAIKAAFGAELNGKRLVVYLANVLAQDNGRGPRGKLADGNAQELPVIEPFKNVNVLNEREDAAKGEFDEPWMLMKFIVTDNFDELPEAINPNTGDKSHAFKRLGYTSIDQIPRASVRAGTALRPHTPILPSEIVRTREVVFARGNGIWQINSKVVDEFVSNFVPELNTAECWILENGGGGWWHPIHIHLESHQQIEYLNEADVGEVSRVLGGVTAKFRQAVADEMTIESGKAGTLSPILQVLEDTLAPVQTKLDPAGDLQKGTLLRGANDEVSLQQLTRATVKKLEEFSSGRAKDLLNVARPNEEPKLLAYLRLKETYGEVADLVAELNPDLVFEDGRLWERAMVPPWDRFKCDTTVLGPNTRVKIFMKFRTFDGPFVFHCHNLEHEDMRMMFVFDPRPTPTALTAPGKESDKERYHLSEQVVRYRHPWRFENSGTNDFDKQPHQDSATPNCNKSPEWNEVPTYTNTEPKAHPIWGGWDQHL